MNRLCRHVLLSLSMLCLSACMSRTEAPVVYYGASDGITKEIVKVLKKDPTFGTIIDKYRWIFPKDVASTSKPTTGTVKQNTKIPPKINNESPKTVPASKPTNKVITAATPVGTFIKPVHGKVISNFGPKADGQSNDGINIFAARGTGVKAAQNGEVIYANNDLEGFGNLVLIRHEKSFVTAYAHLDKIHVTKGQSVRQGEGIGTVGSTGNVASPQLHFEIRSGTKPLNPQKFVKY